MRTMGTGTEAEAAAGTEAAAAARPVPERAVAGEAAPGTAREPLSEAAARVGTPEAAEDTAERVWRNLRAVVLERNERRKETSDALGMSFFRIKALRRIAKHPARLSELAEQLASDRPYLSLVVDDLVKRGLVERHPHPTDRRGKIVSATPAGLATAARANAILGTPPPSLLGLPPADLATLDRITAALAAED